MNKTTSGLAPYGRTATHSGFTIVELLIVIVVIAILAAISIVAYTGIQNRANDTAVQSDIRNFVGKIMEYEVTQGNSPLGGSSGPVGMDNFPVAHGSYSTAVNNFAYCTGTVAGVPAFAVGGVSRSGTVYHYASLGGGIQSNAITWSSTINTACRAMADFDTEGLTRSYGYDRTDDVWRNWTR